MNPSRAEREFEAAVDSVLIKMRDEHRIATLEEIDELEDNWRSYAFLSKPGDEIFDWDSIMEELLTLPPRQPNYLRIHPDDLAALRSHDRTSTRNVHVGRPYSPLPLPRVKSVIGLLRKRNAELKRRGVSRLPTGLGLSYEAISEKTEVPRDRVKQIEALVEEGYDPSRETHPDFPAKEGFVMVPTVAELRRLRRSGRWPR